MIPKYIETKINKDLFLQENHPICIVKQIVYDYFGNDYIKYESLPKIVNTKQNFDDLLIDKEHSSRSKHDTFYVGKDLVLRTHMTCFLTKILIENKDKLESFNKFLYTGDVFRKDEIDASHYPIFHQLDGVCVMNNDENPLIALKNALGGLIEHLFPGYEYEFKEEYYPFNSSAFEVNVKFNDKWVEVLGCGIKRQEILSACGLHNKVAWGFGLGLDRLAMILFGITDIRYLWSEDDRFLSQFKKGEINKFKTFSKFPPVFKDVSFFLNDDYNLNEFYEICRETDNDLIENIVITDKFFSTKENRNSICFRITYRSNHRSLTDVEINEIHNEIKNKINSNSKLKLR